MKISALLNNEVGDRFNRTSSETPRRHSSRLKRETSSDDYTPEVSISTRRTISPLATPKASRSKANNDTNQSRNAPTVGHVNFPPYKVTDETILKELEKLHVRSDDEIVAYPRSIPYSSDKKTFHVQTGRSGFNVFQYEFKLCDASKDWSVMWDYNIGLVRITPFFKALGYAKTIPAKAIGMTPGLTEMCHSITGGSLKAQGYWMPFGAAKALAATFCWNIRHALIPLFGPDFLDICYHPGDPAFKRFTIEESVICSCQEEVKDWAKVASAREATPTRSWERTPATPDSLDEQELASMPEASEEITPRPPRMFTRSRWTAVNLPDSPTPSESQRSSTPASSITLASMTSSKQTSAIKRTFSDLESEAEVSGIEKASDGHSENRRKSARRFGVEETGAAYALLQLSVGESQC